MGGTCEFATLQERLKRNEYGRRLFTVIVDFQEDAREIRLSESGAQKSGLIAERPCSSLQQGRRPLLLEDIEYVE
jgi:hypothetical protein